MLDPSWHPVPGFEGFYTAARSGMVRSIDRTLELPCGQTRRYRGRILKPHIGPGTRGYPFVALSRPGQEPENRAVHQIILETFVGECPEGQEARHGPGGKTDPSLINLCYGTRAENVGPDRLRDGQDNRGERHGLHKLTADQVRDIRQRQAAKEPQKAVAARYGIDPSTVSRIARRKDWAWLE